MKLSRPAAVSLVTLLAACASLRWSGSQPESGRPPAAALHNLEAEERLHPAPIPEAAEDDSLELHLSTSPGSPQAIVPPTPEERYRTALFYSDVGPDAVDVSAYPAQQRYNYEIFARSCSRCHTLARSINAPLVSRGWWEFYILGMRVRSRREGRPLTKDEVKAVLDFLEYDARVRKVEKAREFDQLTEELKRRFGASIAERMRALQKANPHILEPRAP